LEGRTDRDAAQLRGGQRGQSALEAAEGGAGAGDDDGTGGVGGHGTPSDGGDETVGPNYREWGPTSVGGMTTTPAGQPLLPSELVVAIDHVGVAVPDFDAAVAWYRDNLGMENLHEEVNEEQGVRE